MPELPPSRFFDVVRPPKGIAARLTGPERERETGGSRADVPSLSLSPGLSNVPYLTAPVADAKLKLIGELFGIPELAPNPLTTYRTRSGATWDVSLPPVERPHAYVMAEVRPASVKLRVEGSAARRHRLMHPGAHSRRSLPVEVRPALAPGSNDLSTFVSRLGALSLADLNAKAGNRGIVSEFSEKSKDRLRSLTKDLQALGVEADLMLTLTYPGDWKSCVPCGRTAKRHLQAMKSRLGRYFRKLGFTWSALWFLEFQKRGAPHFHLIIWGPAMKHLDHRRARRWALNAWADIVAHPDPIHRARGRKAGTGLDIMRSRHFGYASKYADKRSQKTVPDEYKNVGRFWGLWNYKPPPPVLLSFTASYNDLLSLAARLFRCVREHSRYFGIRIFKMLTGPDSELGFDRNGEANFNIDRCKSNPPNSSFTVFGVAAVKVVTSFLPVPPPVALA